MLLHEVLINYGLFVRLAVERDSRVIANRFKDEGMSFLTITLPILDDALLQGLTQGRITPSMFNGFKPFKRGGSLPALLSGFYMRIFDSDGFLLPRPCLDSIEAIRQICRLYKKIEMTCTDTRLEQAFERFMENEKCISKYSRRSFDSFPNWVAVSGYLWSDLELLASDIYCSPGVFGSGATAERSRPNGRLSLSEWPKRGEREFPLAYHTSHREDDRKGFETLKILGGRNERPVRVVTVPKTLKTPRIIAVEPSYAMLRQQSVWLKLQQYLEGPKFPFNSIRFKDQSMNRELACLGSVDGGLSTIDLSDASDRVSNRLVASTFKSAPEFVRMIFAARTRQAKMPNGELVNLSKFASMGSALCFPIESMVFFTIVMTSLLNQSGMRPSRSVLLRLAKDVAIYGDDIIVPTHTAAGVMRDLEAFGLLVNQNKSYSAGLFRESCGGDYYAGELNTPVYVRHEYENSGKRLSASCIAAYISLSNQFYLKGLWHVSQYIRDTLNDRGIRVGRSTRAIGGLTYASFIFTDVKGFCNRTHQYQVRSLKVDTKRQEDPIKDYRAAMLYSFQQKANSFKKENVFDLVAFDASLYRRIHEPLPDGNIRDGGCSVGPLKRPAIQRMLFCPVSQVYSRFCDDKYSGTWNSMEFVRGIPRPTTSRAYDGTSVRPYSLKLKSRLTPTPVGLSW